MKNIKSHFSRTVDRSSHFSCFLLFELNSVSCSSKFCGLIQYLNKTNKQSLPPKKHIRICCVQLNVPETRKKVSLAAESQKQVYYTNKYQLLRQIWNHCVYKLYSDTGESENESRFGYSTVVNLTLYNYIWLAGIVVSMLAFGAGDPSSTRHVFFFFFCMEVCVDHGIRRLKIDVN
jgi:hypothetical protein